ncbi:MAG: porin [Sedimenticola sp.]
MKKILAVAIAAAFIAPAVSFADVKISGVVKQEFWTDDTNSSPDQGVRNDSDVGVTFSASEDLGNGMTAFAKIDMGKDEASTQNNDQIVGMTGGFGTVVMGHMEDFTEGKVASMASGVDSSDNFGVEPNGANDTGRTSGGIAYVSPTFSGVHVGIAGYAVDSAGTLGGDNFDAYDMLVSYDNGPITVRFAHENNSVVGAAEQKTNSLGAQYKAGDFSVVAVYQSVDDAGGTAGTDLDGWMVGGTYTMGNNKIGLGYMNDELSATTEATTLILDFNHSFSKRTSAYAGYVSTDNPTGTADTDNFYAGMKHTF